MDVKADRHQQRRLAQVQRQELSYTLQESKNVQTKLAEPVFSRPEPCQQDPIGQRITTIFGDLRHGKKPHRVDTQSGNHLPVPSRRMEPQPNVGKRVKERAPPAVSVPDGHLSRSPTLHRTASSGALHGRPDGLSDIDLEEIIREMRTMRSQCMITPACSPARSSLSSPANSTLIPDQKALLEEDLAVSDSDDQDSSSSSDEEEILGVPVATMPSDKSATEPYTAFPNGSLTTEPRSSPHSEEDAPSYNLASFFQTPVKKPLPPPVTAVKAVSPPVPSPVTHPVSLPPALPNGTAETLPVPPKSPQRTSPKPTKKASAKKSNENLPDELAVKAKPKPSKVSPVPGNGEVSRAKLKLKIPTALLNSVARVSPVPPPLVPIEPEEAVLPGKKKKISLPPRARRKDKDRDAFTVQFALDLIRRLPSNPSKLNAKPPPPPPAPAPAPRKVKRKLDEVKPDIPEEPAPSTKKPMLVPPKKSATTNGGTVLDSILAGGKNAKKASKPTNGLRATEIAAAPLEPLPASPKPPPPALIANKVTPPSGSSGPAKTPLDLWTDHQTALPALDIKLDFDHQRNLARGFKREAERIDRPGTRFAVYLQSVVHFTLMARSMEVSRPGGKGIADLYLSTVQMMDTSKRSLSQQDPASLTLLDKVSRYLFHCAHALLDVKVYGLNEEKCFQLGRQVEYLKKQASLAAQTSKAALPGTKAGLANGKSPSPGVMATTSPYSVGSTGSHGSGEKVPTTSSTVVPDNSAVPDSQPRESSAALFSALKEYHHLSVLFVTGFNHWNRSRVIADSDVDPQVRQFVAWLAGKAPLTFTSSMEQLALHLYYALWVLRALKDS